jgi:hypothetical protein
MNEVFYKKYRLVAASVIFCLLSPKLFSQVGGIYTYEFLELTNSARVAALGGKIVSLNDDDLSLPFHNPALLNSQMDNHLVLNSVIYFADINYGYTSYAKDIPKIGTFALGINYIDYGSFTAADSYGATSGNFYANETAINMIYSRPVAGLFRIGLNLKPLFSTLEHYSSFGLVMDMGISFSSPSNLISAGLAIKNTGFVIKNYYEGENELPAFEIQAGISKKLEHAPFRFSLTLQHLEKPDMSYSYYDSSSTDNSTIKTVAGRFGDNLMRHVIIGAEFLPFKNFFVRAGYNYQRRQELKISTSTGSVGFSWGLGIKISKFVFDYGRATYSLAGTSSHLSISTNLSDFCKKAKL